VLLALNVAAAALLIVTLAKGTQTGALLSTPPRMPAFPAFPTTRPREVSRFPILQDRILLYATRHFFVAPTTVATVPKPEYRLVGTFIIPDKPAVALLSGANGTSRKVKPGESLDGWMVEAVETRRVILRSDAETFEISSGGAPKSGLIVQTASTTAPIRLSEGSAESGIRYLGKAPPMAAAAARPLHEPKLTPRLYRPPTK